MTEFKKYGKLSNLKINFSKPVAIGIELQPQQISHFQSSFHLKWTNTALTYLGTRIPPKLSQLYKLKFPTPPQVRPDTVDQLVDGVALVVRAVQHTKNYDPAQIPLSPTGPTSSYPSRIL